MLSFHRYIGIDYSGARTPEQSLPGLRIFMADRDSPPLEVPPPPSPRKYWTRFGVAEWLQQRLREPQPTIAGIDHGFSFPVAYFKHHGLAFDWPAFLDDFHRHWPTDEKNVYVDFVRDDTVGNGAARSGDSKWRRLTERRVRAKSVFHFDVPGSVAKSTHAGLPFLRALRANARGRVHFWPFDGWKIPSGRSAVVEVYPSLWSPAYPREDRTPDQHDAYSAARWLREADLEGTLEGFLSPALASYERRTAELEGWILGVT